MKAAVKLLTLVFVASLTGCDPQLPSKVTAQADEIVSLKQRLGILEVNVSVLEQSVQKQQASVGNWTLWQVTDALNGGYPRALSAYPSKNDCLTASAGWTFPGGKLVAGDPTIVRFKGYNVYLECLPVGTQPYAH